MSVESVVNSGIVLFGYRPLDGHDGHLSHATGNSGWNQKDGRSVHMRACASLAREVPKRNLRSFSLVSGEKEYNRDSDCGGRDGC